MGNVPPDPGDVLCHNFSACSAGTKLASYTYTLGNAGNRTNVLELNSRNVGYGYDNDYRLTSEAITGDPGGNNGTVSYTNYDAVGNRTQMSSTLGAVPGGSFFYDSNDRLSGDSVDNNETKTLISTERTVALGLVSMHT